MVQKTSHRGVYSGNTLRAFNTRYSRRYHSQACIVSRIHPALLQKLRQQESMKGLVLASKSSANKTGPLIRNAAVEVPLSLNKQARWLLPSSLIQQIQTNNFADTDLKVSLLERHKLKRPANCVSFHSNKGEVKGFRPRNGRYFGFYFPRADLKSKRCLRRERREKFQDAMKKNDLKKLPRNTVEVFTEQGKAKRYSEMEESEVRYEVYYPSPSSSSIAHNPKYIKQDTDIALGHSDQHVEHGKPRKQHRAKRRQRIMIKDIDDWEVAAAYDSEPQDTKTGTPQTVDSEEFSSICNVKEERSTTECLLSTLLEKARRLQRFKGTARLRCNRKNRTCITEEDDKSHIVYLNESPEHSIENPKHRGKSDVPSSSIHSVSPMPSKCTRVLLPKDDISLASLKESFGQRYIEVGCKPRKFILDVTPNVRQLLKKQAFTAKEAERTEEAYLICVHDGFYDDEYDVYRVLLNSSLHKGLQPVQLSSQDQRDLFRGTVMNLISQIMDFMQGLVISPKEKKCPTLFIQDHSAKTSHRHLCHHLGSSEIYVPSVKQALQLCSSISDISMPALSDLVQEEAVFCDVCYEDISPLTHGSAPCTSLLTCQHRVCDSCWSQHIHTRFHEGFVRVTCPGFDCQEKVKVGVLLSLAPLETVEKLLLRQEEIRISASQTEKWCPNESCGRVISIEPSSSKGNLQFQQDVVCTCGAYVCFHCLLPAHWPASCKQAEDYRATVATAVFPDRLAEIHEDSKAAELAMAESKVQGAEILLVEGKHCPRCKRFVFKDGGCPQMVCTCGQLFCWYCAKPGYSHPDRKGCVTVEEERKQATTIIVHHFDSKMPYNTMQQQQQSSGKRRQRMTLMERAVEQRKHRETCRQNSHAIATLAKAVATAATKNKVLTQHLARACSGAYQTSHMEPASASVLEMISTFLKKADSSRQELLEVVEYSLVLLKDLPDSLLRRRALRITEDLSAFCSFSQSIFDVWRNAEATRLQEAVKALMRLAEIQDWISNAMDSHVITVKKLRALTFPA